MTGPLTCAEFVELVTDYLEGALDPATEGRFIFHLTQCLGCETYLEQFRLTIREVGRIEPDQIEPVTRDRLLAAFHDWRTS